MFFILSKGNLAIKDEYENITADEIEQEETYNTAKVIEISTPNEKQNKKIIYKFFKRIIDIIGSLIGIIILIPTSLVIYIARKISKEDDGPLFYEQLRYGKNNKVFRIYKFRSMCIGADKKLKEYLQENESARKEFEETHKLRDDPRITKIGNFLRKTSLDELPQMINILKD